MGPEKGEMHVLSRPTRNGQNLSKSSLFLLFRDPTRGITQISLKMMKGRMCVVRETRKFRPKLMALHCNPMEKLWYL